MKNLTETVHLVKEIKLKSSDFLTIDKVKKTNTDIFYQKILTGAFQSDKAAAQFFFNSDTNHSSYKNLKRSFREKLINTLFFIDPKKAHSDYERAYVYCCKNIFLFKMLIRLTAQNVGNDLGQKVLNKALEFEITEFIVLASKQLRTSLGSYRGDEKKFHYFNDIFKKHKTIWEAEALAVEYYSLLVLPYAKSKAKNETTFPKGIEYYEELAPFLAQYEAPYLHFLGNLIKVVAHLSINDYHTVIDVCKKAIHFFEQKSYSYKSPLRVFLHNQLICYIQLGNYTDGEKTALKALSVSRIGTHGWYINKELHLSLALHTKEYEAAYIILNEALNHRKFKVLRPSLKERWLIHKAYLHFLIFIGKINRETSKTKKFKLGKFLNSVPDFSKDKRGLNIPILIIQILYIVVKKDYEQSIDRFEAIQKYCSRYLRKDDSLRSNCFINMLLQIPISGFHKAGVERRAKKYLDKLMATPLDIANQGHEIEIIPYEYLWEFAVEALEAKFYKVKSKR